MKRSKAMESRQKDAIEKKQGLLNDIEVTGGLKLSPLVHHADRLVEIRDFHIDFLPEKTFQLIVCKGERVALAGGNGAGKSSLIKAIAGEAIPCAGFLKTAGGLMISYVSQETPALSGSVFQFAQGAGVPLTQFLTVLINLGLPRNSFDMDLSKFSAGQKRKVMIAKSLCTAAHLYIWDEPLNYLDILSREQIETLLLTCCPTMIFVEHDEFFLRKIGTRTVMI
jgi:lincosamide and streptogramin A transport system ATP-binding/permease protein